MNYLGACQTCTLDPVGLVQGLRFCFSNRLPGSAAGLGTTVLCVLKPQKPFCKSVRWLWQMPQNLLLGVPVVPCANQPHQWRIVTCPAKLNPNKCKSVIFFYIVILKSFQRSDAKSPVIEKLFFFLAKRNLNEIKDKTLKWLDNFSHSMYSVSIRAFPNIHLTNKSCSAICSYCKNKETTCRSVTGDLRLHLTHTVAGQHIITLAEAYEMSPCW